MSERLAKYIFLQKIEKIEGIGIIYQFEQDRKIILTTTDVEKKYYVKKEGEPLSIIREYNVKDEVEGKWFLKNHNELIIIVGDELYTYQIEYLGSSEIRLKKLN